MQVNENAPESPRHALDPVSRQKGYVCSGASVTGLFGHTCVSRLRSLLDVAEPLRPVLCMSTSIAKTKGGHHNHELGSIKNKIICQQQRRGFDVTTLRGTTQVRRAAATRSNVHLAMERQ